MSGASSIQLPLSVSAGDAAGGPDGSDACPTSAAVLPWPVGRAGEAPEKCSRTDAAQREAPGRGAQQPDEELEPWGLERGDAAREARAADRGGDYLENLKGEWQSLKLGYILICDACDSKAPGLLVKKAGDDDKIVGCLRLSKDAEVGGPRVKLQLDPDGGCGKMSDFHIKSAGCTTNRITWVETDHADFESSQEEADVWNKSLIEEIRKAAEWVEHPDHCLRSDLHPGLRALAKDETTSSQRRVGLCIATKNRLWQLRRALPLNLLHSWVHRKWTKIHLVDCDSNDGTLKWVLSKCRAAIDAGLLIVYSTEGRMPFWHASVAKNAAHIVAEEEILVNVDSDNLIGLDFPLNVVQYFDHGSTVLQYEDGDGTCGRIACWASEFRHIRGYDEDAYPMGAQDVDLVLRLKELHPYNCYQKVRHSSFSQAIKNDLQAKVACCDPKLGPGGLRWGRMDTLNRSVFQCRREAGLLERNMEKGQIGLKVRCVSAPPNDAAT